MVNSVKLVTDRYTGMSAVVNSVKLVTGRSLVFPLETVPTQSPPSVGLCDEVGCR